MTGLFLLAALPLLTAAPPASPPGPSASTMLTVQIRTCQGDPLGSAEAGTLKVTAEPGLLTADGSPFEFRSGREVAVMEGGSLQPLFFGRCVRGTAKLGEGDKVFLDLTLEDSALAEQATNFTRLEKQCTRVLCLTRLDETVKIRWSGEKGQAQTWIELSVKKVNWTEGLGERWRF